MKQSTDLTREECFASLDKLREACKQAEYVFLLKGKKIIIIDEGGQTAEYDKTDLHGITDAYNDVVARFGSLDD